MNYIECYRETFKDKCFDRSQYHLKRIWLIRSAISNLNNDDWIFNLIRPTFGNPMVEVRKKNEKKPLHFCHFARFYVKKNSFSFELQLDGKYLYNELDEPKRILNEFLESFDLLGFNRKSSKKINFEFWERPSLRDYIGEQVK